MKKLKYYNNFINEGLKDFLKPKSQENIEKSLQNSNLSNEQKFINGCKYGFIWLVQDILNKGVDPSIYNNIGILLACENGYIDIVKLLLQDKRVNPTDRVLPLVKFAAFLDYTIEDITTSHNEDEEKDILYTDCIDKSYENGHYDIVKLLLNDERVKNSLNDYKLKLYTKVSKKINESIKDYLKPKSEEDILKSINNLTPNQKLLHGLKYDMIELINQSIDEGADVTINDNNLLIWSCENGHTDIVKKILENPNVDVNTQDGYPICIASKNGHYDIVKLLLNHKDIIPNLYHSFCLIWASENGHYDIVKLLLDDGRVDQYSLGYLSKKSAIKNNHYDIVDLLNQYEQE